MGYNGSEAQKKNARAGSEKAMEWAHQAKKQRIIIYDENPKFCSANCGTPLSYEKRRQLFCSTSCSARIGNSRRIPTQFLARVKIYNTAPSYCQACDVILPYDKRGQMFCSRSCAAKVFNNLRSDIPPKVEDPSFANRLKGQVLRRDICEHARFILFSGITEPACLVCGYTFTVEAAHIQPVRSFPSITPLSEVNARNNLLALCPNHHLEFDRGKLKLSDLVPLAGVEPASSSLKVSSSAS